VVLLDIVDELLPEVVEEAEVVLLALVDVDEELPVVLLALALLELVTEATVLLDSMTNFGVYFTFEGSESDTISRA